MIAIADLFGISGRRQELLAALAEAQDAARRARLRLHGVVSVVADVAESGVDT